MSKHPQTDRAFKGSHLETGFINEFCARLETERNEAEAALLDVPTKAMWSAGDEQDMKAWRETHAAAIERARSRK